MTTNHSGGGTPRTDNDGVEDTTDALAIELWGKHVTSQNIGDIEGDALYKIRELKTELAAAQSALAEAKADKMQWVDEATKARDALAEKEREGMMPSELVAEILKCMGPCEAFDHHGNCQSHYVQPANECWVKKLAMLAAAPAEKEKG